MKSCIPSGVRSSQRIGEGRSKQGGTPQAIKSNGSKQVVCSKTITAKSDRRDKVAAVLQEIVKYSEERAQDKANGIVSFQCVKDQWEEDVFHCYERYANNAAMGRHNTDPTMMQLMEGKMLPHLQGPMGWVMYEYKNGKLSNACCPEGPKGEGGLDDATGASGGSGGASMKRQSAIIPVLGDTRHDDHNEDDKPVELLDAVKKGLQSFFSFKGHITKK